MDSVSSPVWFLDPQTLDLNFELICKVNSLIVGAQEFESVTLDFGEEIVFNFANFTQSPDCGYSVNYTVILSEKFDQSEEYQRQGQSISADSLVCLDVVAGSLKIQPADSQVIGKTYEVFILGEVNVDTRVKEYAVSGRSFGFSVTVSPSGPLPN